MSKILVDNMVLRETISFRKIGFSMSNELLKISPNPPKAKTFKFIKYQNIIYPNFVSHPNIFHNMTLNIHPIKK